MTRLRLLVLVLGVCGASLTAGCNKPSDENCRKALANMQVLLGTENVSSKEQIEAEVRRCKGGSTRESVDCAIKASSLEELRACGFMKLPAGPPPPAGSAAGSSEAPAGPAAGSAAK